MTSIMFETFCVPALYVGNHAVLSLYVIGRTTGIVLESGDSVTHVQPIYEGCGLRYPVMRLNLGGRDITDYLVKLLSESGYFMTTSPERIIVKEMKESLSYIAQNYEEELTKTYQSSHQKYEYVLPDESKIIMTNGRERFQAPEILFKPSLILSRLSGIHEAVHFSIQKCDSDLIEQMYQNICSSGGSTLFEGIKERLRIEVEKLAPVNTKVRIHGAQERKHGAWIGGSIFSSLSSMRKMWISTDEYNDSGDTIIHRKCFTGGCIAGGDAWVSVGDSKDEDLMERILLSCENI